MKDLRFKKIVAVVMALALTLALSLTVFAHDWPSDLKDWSDSDWQAWEEALSGYYAEAEEEHEREREREKETEKSKDKEIEREYSRDYDRDYEHTIEAVVYEEPTYTYTYTTGATGVVNTGTAGVVSTATATPYNGNIITNTNTGVITNTTTTATGTANFYNGIINAYDASLENQAVILAKIIHLYAHGVSSQTAQACVGWTVFNSIDASGGGVDIGSIAPNFNYNANEGTVDDFGRDLMPLARDIIFRWKAGKNGIAANGRVLPAGYCWVWSSGSAVVFRNTPNESGAPWNYTLASPYGN